MPTLTKTPTEVGILTAAIFHMYGRDLYLIYDGTHSAQLLAAFFDQAQSRLYLPKSTLRLNDKEANDRAARALVGQYDRHDPSLYPAIDGVSSIDIILRPVSGGRPVGFSPYLDFDRIALVSHLRFHGYLDTDNIPTPRCNDGRLSDAFKTFSGFHDINQECEAYRQFSSSFTVSDALEYTRSGSLVIHTTPVHLKTLRDIICRRFYGRSYWEGQEMAGGGYGDNSYAFLERQPTSPGSISIEAIKLLMVGAESDTEMVRRRFMTSPLYFDV